MRLRSAAPLALAAIVVAGSFAPATAARKDLKKKYDVNLSPMPDATEETACSGDFRDAANMHVEKIKVAGAGKLTVKVTGFNGDWDVAVYSAAGAGLAEGSGTTTPDAFSTPATPLTETLKYKSKKAQTLHLRVCNFAGSPAASVEYVYEYA